MIRLLTKPERSWFIEWIQQWDQLWTDCNWYDYDLIWIRCENDKIMGGFEATFIILGLGFRWRWNHTKTEQMKFCEDAIEDINSCRADLVAHIASGSAEKFEVPSESPDNGKA